MLKIGCNDSSMHKINNHVECPERVSSSSDYLRNQFRDYLYDLFLNKTPVDRENVLAMIKQVHSDTHINSFENKIHKVIICSNCNHQIFHNSKTFGDFLVDRKVCKKCSNVLNKNNIHCKVDGDTYYTPYTFDIVLEAVWVLKKLIDEITNKNIQYGYALIRPPGHHCCNIASGFCIVNNAVIAAKYAQENGFKNVVILDIDFHHGDGTAKLIKKMDNIYLVSIHGYGQFIYPGTGSSRESTAKVLNLPIHVDQFVGSRLYVDDAYYLEIVKKRAIPFIKEKNPDLIIISNGFDGHKDDPLEGFNITNDTYTTITELLMEFNLPLLFVLEGGYSIDVISEVSEKMINKLLNI